ncbi:conserved Plasmodium protein, unknown function [Plasmodium knowlesi strain H]|uniref:Uncharacterized protein n=3 Tax=Plasmodium knowlesi TaxID=5850 RepID=A0A5K1UMI3_PLAKH|nr:conserved protein, unknown function [Plasmodium knowlesi strain H]OTN67349.1 Uncharacterized protein PKNOH_S06429700 [Plasmodium knowlesi]CAA9987567.1 conserved protein, unknown function [Plasmodium knowlesi strain H]SBO27041.1 conserved Plasmodium protein, unknown function [Plasmodium knowlesi strain H]SBO29204.1 conserved Plasmodium protein, unknown function [Plasmodium knowlesi strain H]VVS77041.1 conserved protein, unknown function [Plasmodium knowlesi strain H]|eukprot:XP_002258570.1 hypothetical protein, conserved in Plasmodium species [Plasmodium knowlesi strain H]
MGNFLGLKENKYNKTNINIFEKRYGYNLNDLHSYVYKINLPLKPRYVSYVLQEKGKRASGEEPNGVPPDGDLPNVTSHLDCEADSMDNTSEGKQFLAPVDIYNRYDRDNLHNSSNIYQNKLKINQKGQEEDHQKYEDMYVHMSYDNKYIYDQHKNNIYEEYSIYNYVSKKTPQLMSQKKEGVKKTYANLCLNYYNNLDTCMIKKYQKNVQNRKYKFTRLHTCKPHYILFSRCVMYRDKKLMNEIKKVELNYYNSLSRDSRSLYLNEFTTNLNYHEYLISKMHDGVEKIKIKKELDELRERYNHIVKYANAGFTEAPTFEAPQETTYLNEKKYILLNL